MKFARARVCARLSAYTLYIDFLSRPRVPRKDGGPSAEKRILGAAARGPRSRSSPLGLAGRAHLGDAARARRAGLRRSPALCVAGSRREREEWEWRVDGVAASHKYYFYAGAAPSPQHRPRSLLFADLSIAARRSLSIKRFQWPGVRRSEAFR